MIPGGMNLYAYARAKQCSDVAGHVAFEYAAARKKLNPTSRHWESLKTYGSSRGRLLAADDLISQKEDSLREGHHSYFQKHSQKYPESHSQKHKSASYKTEIKSLKKPRFEVLDHKKAQFEVLGSTNLKSQQNTRIETFARRLLYRASFQFYKKIQRFKKSFRKSQKIVKIVNPVEFLLRTWLNRTYVALKQTINLIRSGFNKIPSRNKIVGGKSFMSRRQFYLGRVLINVIKVMPLMAAKFKTIRLKKSQLGMLTLRNRSQLGMPILRKKSLLDIRILKKRLQPGMLTLRNRSQLGMPILRKKLQLGISILGNRSRPDVPILRKKSRLGMHTVRMSLFNKRLSFNRRLRFSKLGTTRSKMLTLSKLRLKMLLASRSGLLELLALRQSGRRRLSWKMSWWMFSVKSNWAEFCIKLTARNYWGWGMYRKLGQWTGQCVKKCVKKCLNILANVPVSGLGRMSILRKNRLSSGWAMKLAWVGTIAMLPYKGVLYAQQNVPIPYFNLGVRSANSAEEVSLSLQVLLLLSILTIAPSIIIMMTSFIRVTIILKFVQRALSLQQEPPNQVIMGLALFITFFIMAPTINEIYEEAYVPYANQKISTTKFFETGVGPLKDFMLKQTREKDIDLFLYLSKKERPETAADVSLVELIPAFIISEITYAFQIGIYLFIPFIVIDMIVASILMSMGMILIPPIAISLPFKIILFVLVDGWHLITLQAVRSFG
ncbi:flagellar biosynthetic protein FliP [Spirochaetota bacterium]|nr:flagellar biosynthetic protein FliP [Spirochaetota bacterium]